MTKFQETVEILAPPESVWKVLSDPTYIPKLYRDAISVELDPPGPAAVGHRCTVHGRVGGLRVASTVEYTKVEKEKCIAGAGLPGGMFSVFFQEVSLTRKGWDTEVKISFEYQVLPEYATKVPEPALVEKMLSESFRGYGRSLKELSELVPLAE